MDFQVINWHFYHERNPSTGLFKLVIQLFGRTLDDKDVCVRVTDFEPFFYIGLPQEWFNEISGDPKSGYYIDRKLDSLKYAIGRIIDNAVEKKRNHLENPFGSNRINHRNNWNTNKNNNQKSNNSNKLFEEFELDNESDSDNEEENYFGEDNENDNENGEENNEDTNININGIDPGYTNQFFKQNTSNRNNTDKSNIEDNYNNKVNRLKNLAKLNYSSKNIVSLEIEKHISLHGFTNNTKIPVIKIKFNNLDAMMTAAHKLESYPITIKYGYSGEEGFNDIQAKIYESSLKPEFRLIHLTEIKTCGWITIPYGVKLLKQGLRSYCDFTFEVPWKKIKPSKNIVNAMSNVKISCYDLEAISPNGGFPIAARSGDKVTILGTTIYDHGNITPKQLHAIVLGYCPPIPNINVIKCRTERDLYITFARLKRKLRPDIESGYNTHTFDDPYIWARINYLNVYGGQYDVDKDMYEETTPLDKRNESSLIYDHKDFNDIADEFGWAHPWYSEYNYFDKFGRYIWPELSEVFLNTLSKMPIKEMIDKRLIDISTTEFSCKNMSSKARGISVFKRFIVPGILNLDTHKSILATYQLEKYSLDFVSSTYIKEKITFIEFNINDNPNQIIITSNYNKALECSSFIQLIITEYYNSSIVGEYSKYVVQDIKKEGKSMKITFTVNNKDELETLQKYHKSGYDRKLCDISWAFAKDDLPATEITSCFMSCNPELVQRLTIYCVKDCILVNLLIARLEIIMCLIQMSNVTTVPIFYLSGGQGIKGQSLVTLECSRNGYILPENKRVETTEKYEGAMVVDPEPGIYSESPISVDDLSSLYPRCEMEKNLTPEGHIVDKKYLNLPTHYYHVINLNRSETQITKELIDVFSCTKFKTGLSAKVAEPCLNHLKRKYEELTKNNNQTRNNLMKNKRFNVSKYVSSNNNNNGNNYNPIDCLKLPVITNQEIKNNNKIHIFAQEIVSDDKFEREVIQFSREIREKYGHNEDEDSIKLRIENEKEIRYNYLLLKDGTKIRLRYGIIPRILARLLIEREFTKKQAEKETDPNIKAILDKKQEQEKIAANGIYGLQGFSGSKIFYLPVSESTTLIGYRTFYLCKTVIECCFENAKVIYGDTDSVFCKFDLSKYIPEHLKEIDEKIKANKTITWTPEEQKLKQELKRLKIIKSIEEAKLSKDYINAVLPYPQKIVYEKTYVNLILESKKHYIGCKYEENPDKFDIHSRGSVLNRRDFARIVKIVLAELIIYIIINDDKMGAFVNCKENLWKIINGEYKDQNFVITKNLKDNDQYSNPESIAHRVLANRMAERDPGSAPKSNERISYVYFQDLSREKGTKQGMMIEEYSYFKAQQKINPEKYKLDYVQYLESQVIKRVYSILKLAVDKNILDQMINEVLTAGKNKQLGQKVIDPKKYTSNNNQNIIQSEFVNGQYFYNSYQQQFPIQTFYNQNNYYCDQYQQQIPIQQQFSIQYQQPIQQNHMIQNNISTLSQKELEICMQQVTTTKRKVNNNQQQSLLSTIDDPVLLTTIQKQKVTNKSAPRTSWNIKKYS